MDHTNKIRWYATFLAIAIAGSAFFGFRAVSDIIDGLGESSWTVGIVWFTLCISFLFLVPFSFGRKSIWFLAAASVGLPGLFFSPTPAFLPYVVTGGLLAMIGLIQIHRDVGAHLRIRVRRSAQVGSVFLVLAFSLMISGLYAGRIRFESSAALLERLSVNQASNAFVTKVLGWMNPDFKKADREHISVDEFLLSLQQSQLAASGGALSAVPNAQMKEIMLAQSRAQLSEIVGGTLSGTESITEVFSKIIQQKTLAYLQPLETGESGNVLIFILAILLFLTLWSLGTVMAFLARFLSALWFRMLRLFGVIVVKTISVEKEVLEE